MLSNFLCGVLGALTLTGRVRAVGVHGEEGFRKSGEEASFAPPPPTPWVKPKGGGSCSTDFDCNLAGECDQHRTRTCYCDAAWTGSRCQFLDAKPNRGTAALRLAHSSSWGGRTVVESQSTPSPPKTQVHGFFSVLGGSCGMNLWDNVSFIAHTISESPDGAGPHAVADVAIPTFASCVDHFKINDTQTGEELYVLFHNGDGQPRACGVETPDCSQKPIGWIADCSGPGTADNGTTPDAANVTAYPASPPPIGFIPSNGVHVSNDPAGPWRPPVPGAVLGYPYCDCPAVHALRNGSVVVWCQAVEFNYTTPANATASVPQLFINQGWGTPFEARDVSMNIPVKFSEIASRYKQVLRFDEPTLWVDERGNWHALMHNGDGFYPCGDNMSSVGAAFRDNNPLPIGCTAHFFSSDGLNWTMSAYAAHNSTLSLAGGSHVDMFLRRPKVGLRPAEGEVGHVITALFHGAMQCGGLPILANATEPQSHCTNTPWPLDGNSDQRSSSSGGGGGGDGGDDGGGRPVTTERASLGMSTYNNLDYSFSVVVPLLLPEDIPSPP